MRAVLILAAMLFVLPVAAQQGSGAESYRGLWVSAPYPSIEVSPDDSITFDLTVHNAGLPPQRVQLSLSHVPEDWAVKLLGGGQPVSAVFVGPGDNANVTLELDPPQGTAKSAYNFSVAARGDQQSFELPLEVTLGEAPPAQLTLESELPVLPGTPETTFTYTVEVANDTGEDALVALSAKAPRGFQVSFKEEFGSQKLSSVAIDAGDSKSIKVEVDPPQGIKAGTYPVDVLAEANGIKATTNLKLDVSGQPQLKLTGPGGRLSGRAKVGEETPLQLILQNQGSAPAQDIELSASQFQGWDVTFEPKRVDVLPAGKQVQIKALVTPPADAIAGDYMLTLKADGNIASERADYRVTLETSTLWGIAGVAIIAIAIAILGLAVARYGRR